MYKAIKTLIAHGVPADHILMRNLPDLAKTPGAINLVAAAFPNSPFLQKIVLRWVTTISRLYNFDLKMWLKFGIQQVKGPKVIAINPLFNTLVNRHRFA
jgi:hypothetical protein